MHTFTSLDEFATAGGTALGPTDWMTVEQKRVDTFADATDDHQWIHTDPEQAKDGPYGGTIAHGLLTLSMVPAFLREMYVVQGMRVALNYGYDRIRFVSPVPVGARIRGRAEITRVDPIKGGVQAHITTTIEVEGSDRPACVVESIARYLS